VASVNYLNGGESPTAARMNALWDVFDRKLATILSDKSPIVALNQRVGVNGFPGDLLGKCFFFTDGALPSKFALRCPDAKVKSGTNGVDPVTGLPVPGISNVVIHRYDHALFTNAQQSLNFATATLDEGRSIVEVDALDASHYGAGLAKATNVSIFDHSLQTHKYRRPADGKVFWIQERGVAHPEKFYRFAVAEIVLEGVTELNIPDTWDKYVFFRIHNLNDGVATVTFGGGATKKQITCAALECVPVRRTRTVVDGVSTFSNYRVGGIFEFGGNQRRYFFPFERGDLRHYWMYHASWVAGATNNNQFSRDQDTPANAMVANNLTNPALIYDWIKLFKYDRAADVDNEGKYAWFHPDPHEAHELIGSDGRYGNYYKENFADPSNVNARLGDLLWHRGKCLLVKYHKTEKMAEFPTLPRVEYKEIEFKGFATVAADWATDGIDVTTDGNGLLRFKQSTTGDHANWDFMLIPYGTNLFRQPNEGYRTAVDLRNFVTIDPHVFDRQLEPVQLNQVAPQILVRRNTSAAANQKFWTDAERFFDFGTAGIQSVIEGDPPLTLLDVAPPAGSAKTLWAAHSELAGEVLSLNWFGDNNQLTQNTDWTQYTDKRLVLTPFGLQLLFWEQIPAEVFTRAANDLGADPVRFGEGWELSGNYFRRARMIKFRGHGFPWAEEGRATSMFFSPRDGRRLMKREKFLQVVKASAGADYKSQLPQSSESGVKVCRRVKQSFLTNDVQSGRFWEPTMDDSWNEVWTRVQGSGGFVFGTDSSVKVWLALARADLLANTANRGKRAAFSLLREHFNGMAMTVNQLVEGKQLDFRALRFVVTWSGQSYVIGLRPHLNLNVWTGRTSDVGESGGAGYPVPYEAFDYHFNNPSGNTQRTFALYAQAGIPVKTAADIPGWNDLLAARNVDRRIALVWEATVSGSGQDVNESSPTFGWYLSNVDLRLSTLVSYPDSARPAGTAYFYNLQTFGRLQDVYAGFRWVSFTDIYNWLSSFGLPIVYDECFLPLELRTVKSSRTQHEGRFHDPEHSFHGPTAHDLPGGSVFVGSANNLDKTHAFNAAGTQHATFHRDVEMLAFAPVADNDKANELATGRQLWKAPLANGFVSKNVKYWKHSQPLRYVAHGVPNFTTAGSGSLQVPAQIRFMDNPIIQFSPGESYRVFGGSTNSAYLISKAGPYLHLEWGPEVDAGEEAIAEHELWLQMNFRGLFPIAFRAGGGNDFTAKPNFLMHHVDFWAVEVDHFNSRVEYAWQSIWNQGGELGPGIFKDAPFFGITGETQFSTYQAFPSGSVHPWRWEENQFKRRLAPAIATGLTVLANDADLNPEGKYGVMYYANFVRRFSTIAL
jgi:hypothetical protein